MSSSNLTPFAGQKYLNLESIKKKGTPVQTPVWFAEEQGVLYVYTLAHAGKVRGGFLFAVPLPQGACQEVRLSVRCLADGYWLRSHSLRHVPKPFGDRLSVRCLLVIHTLQKKGRMIMPSPFLPARTPSQPIVLTLLFMIGLIAAPSARAASPQYPGKTCHWGAV